MYNCVSIKYFQYIFTKGKMLIEELLPLSNIPSHLPAALNLFPHSICWSPVSMLYLLGWNNTAVSTFCLLGWSSISRSLPMSTCKVLWLLCLQMSLAPSKIQSYLSVKNKFLFPLVTIHTNIYLEYTSFTKQQVFMCDLVGLWSAHQFKGKENNVKASWCSILCCVC